MAVLIQPNGGSGHGVAGAGVRRVVEGDTALWRRLRRKGKGGARGEGGEKVADGGQVKYHSEPEVPSEPPYLENTWRTLATVRVGLSVAVSTNTAIPWGA